MRTAQLGSLGPVSRLTLGGGIGQIWGESSHEESVATVQAAIDAGITLIDAAPMYRNAESFIGEAFAGRPPAGVRFWVVLREADAGTAWIERSAVVSP